MSDKHQPEQGTQPEAGAQHAPPAEATSTPRASDTLVTAQAAPAAVAEQALPQAVAAAQAPKADAVLRGKVPTVPASAPLYRVRAGAKPHLINGRIVHPGESVRYTGVPGRDLEGLDAAAKAAVEAASKARDERKAEEEAQRINKHKLIKALKSL